MKKLRPAAIVCWAIAALPLISSFTFLPGKIGEFVVGLMLAAVLGFVGYRVNLKPPKAKPATTPKAPASQPKPGKQQVISTVLNGSNAKNRQTLLQELLQTHQPLVASLDTKGGYLVMCVGINSSKLVGTVEAKILRILEEQYPKANGNGLNCKVLIGENYQIGKTPAGELNCSVQLAVVPL